MENKEFIVEQGELSQEALENDVVDVYTPSEDVTDYSYVPEEDTSDSYEPEMSFDEIEEQTLRYLTKRAEKFVA